MKTHFRFSHVLGILGFLSGVILGVQYIPDGEWANRFQHIFGGGFMIVLVSYFSYKASHIPLSKFQFFCLSFLGATAFGVLNELAESIFQLQFSLVFAPHIADTWYDLWANTIGAVLGSVVFSCFIKNIESKTSSS